jgi:hypothetical protein
VLKRSSKSLLDADDSTAFSSWDSVCRVLSGICLGLGVAGLDSPSFDADGRPFSSPSSLSFYRYDKRSIRHTKTGLLAFKRSTKKRLKRFHRPAIPAVSEMTLSISRGFTSSSERGNCVGRRPTVGEGAADGMFAFATSASYTVVQPDTIDPSAQSIPYASLPVLPPTPR